MRTRERSTREQRSIWREEFASKWLTDTEEYVEMPQVLRFEKRTRLTSWNRKRLDIAGRIQIVSKVKTQGPDRCFISYANSYRMRSVIVPRIIKLDTLRRRQLTSGHARLGILLMPPHQAFQHVVWRGEDVAHIVKNRETKSF